MGQCDFTMRHYREILESALEMGYQFSTFADTNQ